MQSKPQPTRRTHQDGEMHFRHKMERRKAIIEKLCLRSVANQIYTFPRIDNLDSTGSSETAEDEFRDTERLQYDLKTQNKKNQSHQTTINVNPKGMLKSKNEHKGSLRKHNESVNSLNESQGKLESLYQSKTKKTVECTQLNSSKKNLIPTHVSKTHREQHKKSSGSMTQSIMISFRGTKKPAVNVSFKRESADSS